ncbi:DUF4235 domain-containing protein [Streptomyces sp. NPDC088747]|uniref:DUF4235 domain-containing protein n=1 Tax=Streptomyces sp. NPDC088747 TaxID=3365886 RepID=UPI00382E6840
MKASALVYKPAGLLLGAAGSKLAGAAFRRAWKLVGHDEKPNDASNEVRPWRQVLLAAALQGATFAVVRAVVDRSGARSGAGDGPRRLTEA